MKDYTRFVWGSILFFISIAEHRANAQLFVNFYENESVRTFSDTPNYDPNSKTKEIIVFSPGIMSAQWLYDGSLIALANAGFFVVSYDLYGQGVRSRFPGVTIPNSPQEGGGSFDAYVARLAQVINRYAGSNLPVTLFGHSYGGAISLVYASRFPARVKGLMFESGYSGLPLTGLEKPNLFNLNILGILGASVRLDVRSTLLEFANNVKSNPSIYGQIAKSSTIASIISGRLRVVSCVHVLIGNVCSSFWTSADAKKVESELKKVADFDSMTGGFPMMDTFVMVQAETALNQALENGSNWAKDIRFAVTGALENDPLTPGPLVQSVADRIQARGAQLVDRQFYTPAEISQMSIAGTPREHWVFSAYLDRLVNQALLVSTDFKIQFEHSGKYLDLSSLSDRKGVRLVQNSSASGARQVFFRKSTGDGYFQLINKYSGKCIDIDHGSSDPGVQLQQWDCNNGEGQRFRIDESSRILIKSSRQCFDVYQASQDNGAAVTQYPCHNGTNQMIHLKRAN